MGSAAISTRLITPAGAPHRFEVAIDGDGSHDSVRTLAITEGGRSTDHLLSATQHPDYLDLFAALATVFATRTPLSRQAHELPSDGPGLTPLLTENLDPRILYGYGDPCVVRVGEADWRLVVTSNDAPDAFPMLRSADLQHWTPTGFVFPDGHAPAWCLTGANLADFWAPELHRVGQAWWLVFTARTKDHSLAIGLATAPSPDGPFTPQHAPLLGDGVIDPHILVGPDGPLLVWKVDDNHHWPFRLAELLHARPELVAELFATEADRRTVCLHQALWPWIETLEPMEQFFLNQPLIEAVTGDFPRVRGRLEAMATATPDLAAPLAEIVTAMKTRVFAQPMSPDGQLVGERTLIMENDLDWEAHLIEGVWTIEHAGRWWLTYAGNDFSTPHYGVGAAVAEHPLGPYRKLARPLLTSTGDWWGPGHPSIARGPEGDWRIFLHAFAPGQAGYKAFRALLMGRVSFDGDEMRIV